MRIRALLAGLVLGVGSLVALAGSAAAQTEEGGEPEISHEAEECIHILEDGGDVDECQEAPSPIVPATDELIWGVISFTLVFLGLWKFGLPPLRKSMADRTERIRASLDEAESVKAEAEQTRAEYQRQVADARNEAAGIIEEARQTADHLRRDLAAKAEAEATELRQRNAEQITAER